MWWELILSLAALFSHSGENLAGTSGTHEENLIDGPHREFTYFEQGPLTPEEEAAAHKALNGDKFGGDMVWPDNFNESGDGIKDVRFRWTGYPGSGVVPFVLDPSLEPIKWLIYLAMAHYRLTNCIQFVERTDQKDYVYLYKGEGCWSVVGRQGGKQNLSLGDGCDRFGSIVHELGHAIGLFHEHQRSDRDDYIWVYKENVKRGKLDKFSKINPGRELIYTQYDYSSIMHYGNYAFSKEPNNLMTIQAKNGKPLIEPYHKLALTKSDIYQIQTLYKCPSGSNAF